MQETHSFGAFEPNYEVNSTKKVIDMLDAFMLDKWEAFPLPLSLSLSASEYE